MKSITYDTLEQDLVTAIPEIADRIAKERQWWREEKPGPHIIVGDILTPYLLDRQAADDEPAVTRALEFMERLATSDDVRVQELAAFSFLERLVEHSPEHMRLRRRLPPALGRLLNEVEQFHKPNEEKRDRSQADRQ